MLTKLCQTLPIIVIFFFHFCSCTENKGEDIQYLSTENSLLTNVHKFASEKRNTFVLVFNTVCSKCKDALNLISNSYNTCDTVAPFVISIDKTEDLLRKYLKTVNLQFPIHFLVKRKLPVKLFTNELSSLSIGFSGSVPIVIIFDKNMKVLFKGSDLQASLKLRELLCQK